MHIYASNVHRHTEQTEVQEIAETGTYLHSQYRICFARPSQDEGFPSVHHSKKWIPTWCLRPTPVLGMQVRVVVTNLTPTTPMVWDWKMQKRASIAKKTNWNSEENSTTLEAVG